MVLSPETIAKLRATLGDLKPVHRMTHEKLSFLEYPPLGQSLANLYLVTEGGIVDVLGNVLGISDYQALARNAVEIPLFGRRCGVISLEDLIKAKEAMGPGKGFADRQRTSRHRR